MRHLVIDGVQRFTQAVNSRRVQGSSFDTLLAFALLAIIGWDFAGALLGVTGPIVVTLQVLCAIFPERWHGPTLLVILALPFYGGLTVTGLWALRCTPWRRWIGPSLRAHLPFAVLWRGDSSSPAKTRTLWVQALAVLCVAAPVTFALSHLKDTLLAPAWFYAALVACFAYLSVWLGGTVLANTLWRQGTVSQGDRATAQGLLVALLISLPATLLTDGLPAVLHGLGLGETGIAAFRQAGFYGALSLLVLICALCLGSVSDTDIEVLDIEPGHPQALIELPDCRNAEFAPFLFRVRGNGNQLVLLACRDSAPTRYELRSIEDLHDPTEARYYVINFSALLRQQREPLTVGYTLHHGYFVCAIELALSTYSVEAFISQLRRSGSAFPMEAFALFNDQLVARGLSAHAFQYIFGTAVESVEAAVAREIGTPHRRLPEVRSLVDTLTQSANETLQVFAETEALFRDAHRSVLERGRKDLSIEHAVRGMQQVRHRFDMQSHTVLLLLRGEDELRKRIHAAAQRTAAQAIEALLCATLNDPQRQREARCFAQLIRVNVAGVKVARSASAIETEREAKALIQHVAQAHAASLKSINNATAQLGQQADAFGRDLLGNPSLPFALREEIGQRYLRSFDTMPAQPAPIGVKAAPSRCLNRAPTVSASSPGLAQAATPRSAVPLTRPDDVDDPF